MIKAVSKLAVAVVVVMIMALPTMAQTWDIGPDENPSAVTATLSEGTLTISGMGAMRDYGFENVPVSPPWSSVRNSIITVVIENGVTTIGDQAFNFCRSLTSITIGDSVTTIGASAFRGCIRLTSITIGNSVTTIGNGAFSGCTNLRTINYNATNVTNTLGTTQSVSLGEHWLHNAGTNGAVVVNIGNNVIRIPDNLFNVHPWATNRPNITHINFGAVSSLETIGASAFRGLTGLTSITIPNSVTTIGDEAFEACAGLTSIEVASDNANFCSEDGVLFNKDKTTLIKYPLGKQGASYTIPNGVITIGNNAFLDCTSLTSVTIPNSVTTIGDEAFSGCTGLTSVTIPNSVTTIRRSAFQGCTGLTSVTIGNNVTTIGDGVFWNCWSLDSIISLNPIPPTIGVHVFNVNVNACLYVPQAALTLTVLLGISLGTGGDASIPLPL